MNPLWQLYIRPEEVVDASEFAGAVNDDGAWKLKSGLFIPEVSDTYDSKQRMDRNELRPLQGTVIHTPSGGYWAMYDERIYKKSEYARSYGVRELTDAGKMSEDMNGRRFPLPPEAKMAMPWRMPQPGDTVWFGFMSWTWEREPQFMWPDEIYWVVPQEGEPYALGDWCIVAQIREKAVSDSGLVTSHNPGHELGRGVVLAMGDGFKMQRPGIEPGMTILFKVYGSQNPEVRNPFGGDNATRIRPSQVVAIESEGISRAELERRESEAQSIIGDATKIKTSIRTVDELDVESGKQMAMQDMEKKQRRYDENRYHGRRINH